MIVYCDYTVGWQPTGLQKACSAWNLEETDLQWHSMALYYSMTQPPAWPRKQRTSKQSETYTETFLLTLPQLLAYQVLEARTSLTVRDTEYHAELLCTPTAGQFVAAKADLPGRQANQEMLCAQTLQRSLEMLHDQACQHCSAFTT
jgi:hypothetical protein